MASKWFAGHEAELLRLWHHTNLSASQIGERFGVSRNAVVGWMHRHALPRGAYSKYDLKFCQEVAAAYFREKSSLRAVSSRFGVPIGSVKWIAHRGGKAVSA